MKQVLLEKAYVLHRRHFRETSLLIEWFSKEHGRFTTIAKGMRRARNNMAGLFEPFVPLMISYQGKTELLNLTHVERTEVYSRLHGECLFAAFYLNELLLALLQKHDAHPKLFSYYEESLHALRNVALFPQVLREFERQLLIEVGFGLFANIDEQIKQQFNEDSYYAFYPTQGFVAVPNDAFNDALFSGKILLQIAHSEWNEQSLKAAKTIHRHIINSLLGTKSINSRQLFKKFAEK